MSEKIIGFTEHFYFETFTCTFKLLILDFNILKMLKYVYTLLLNGIISKQTSVTLPILTTTRNVKVYTTNMCIL